MNRQDGSAPTEWIVMTAVLAMALYFPLDHGRSAAGMIFESVQVALENNEIVVGING